MSRWSSVACRLVILNCGIDRSLQNFVETPYERLAIGGQAISLPLLEGETEPSCRCSLLCGVFVCTAFVRVGVRNLELCCSSEASRRTGRLAQVDPAFGLVPKLVRQLQSFHLVAERWSL